AFFEAPDNGSVSSPPLVIVVPPPSALPAAGGLVMTLDETSADLLAGQFHFVYSASANGTAGLGGTYPAGDYVLEMAVQDSAVPQSSPVPTNSVSLSVASADYPPVPQLTSSKVIPLATITNGLTVAWFPWAGAAANSYISFQILDPASNVVFSAPNSCSNLLLPASSGSIAIPGNTLSNDVSYEIVLSFLSLSDSSEYMPNIP